MPEGKKEKERQLVRDPVCGMWIYPEYAADEVIYKEKIFYFCAPGCKMVFEREPERYFNHKSNGSTKSEQETF